MQIPSRPGNRDSGGMQKGITMLYKEESLSRVTLVIFTCTNVHVASAHTSGVLIHQTKKSRSVGLCWWTPHDADSGESVAYR